jgi:hypothetical protein
MYLFGIQLAIDTLPVISLAIDSGIDYGISTVSRIRRRHSFLPRVRSAPFLILPGLIEADFPLLPPAHAQARPCPGPPRPT